MIGDPTLSQKIAPYAGCTEAMELQMIAEDAWKDYAAYMRLSAIPLHKRMKYEQFRSHIADERRYEALLKDYIRLNASGLEKFRSNLRPDTQQSLEEITAYLGSNG